MDDLLLSEIGALSIGIAAVAGLVRWKIIHPSYRPFIIICWIAFGTELISTWLVNHGRDNALPYNIYGIVEAFLYLILFNNWGEFAGRKHSFMATTIFVSVVWLTDNFIFNSILTINPLFWIVYSFTLIFISINQVSRLLVTNVGVLLKNPRFMISMCIIIFYSYTAILQVWFLLKLNFSLHFYQQVQLVQDAVNFIVNLIFALAIIWIPTKQKFILPFS